MISLMHTANVERSDKHAAGAGQEHLANLRGDSVGELADEAGNKSNLPGVQVSSGERGQRTCNTGQAGAPNAPLKWKTLNRCQGSLIMIPRLDHEA